MNANSFANDYWDSNQYQLIDFGNGRKLERFGELILDRACPAASLARPADPNRWTGANVRVTEQSASSHSLLTAPLHRDQWSVCFERVRFQLRLTPFGHVGLFPEHAAQWNWLAGQSFRFHGTRAVLNLFAYTGGASLVLASHGWHVTHVDSSEPTVQWARQNADLSELAEAPIRWLVEDARRYVARELKRGRRYEAILLDPPSYGHGTKGDAWQIERDLAPLLEQCCQLLLPTGVLVLSGHSERMPVSALELTDMRYAAGHLAVATEASPVDMRDLSERCLNFGWSLRSAPTNSESR